MALDQELTRRDQIQFYENLKKRQDQARQFLQALENDRANLRGQVNAADRAVLDNEQSTFIAELRAIFGI